VKNLIKVMSSRFEVVKERTNKLGNRPQRLCIRKAQRKKRKE
jgi:hypothetical protein